MDKKRVVMVSIRMSALNCWSAVGVRSAASGERCVLKVDGLFMFSLAYDDSQALYALSYYKYYDLRQLL